jgi:hypothetical protein
MPIRTWKADGTPIFNSDTAAAGVCIGLHHYAAGVGEVRTYPQLAGAVVRAFTVSGNSAPFVDYDLGYPRVTIASQAFPRVMSVWATSPPTILAGAGIKAKNASGALVLTPEGFGLHYAGLATPHSTVPNMSGGNLKQAGYSVLRFTSATAILPVIRLDAGLWSALLSVTDLGGGTWEVSVRHVSATLDGHGLPTLATPTVYCYNRPATANSAPRFAMFDAAGVVTWDLMREKLLTVHAMPDFGVLPTSGGVDEVSVPAATVMGVFGSPGGFNTNSDFVGSGLWDNLTYSDAWSRDFGGPNRLSRTSYLVDQYRDDGPADFNGQYAPRPMVVNLTGV